jgi:CRISPR/Cas system CMR-associated protein Cmr5 small subunit
MKNTITAYIKKITIGISTLILFGAICIFYFIIPVEDRSVVNGFTVFGTSLSLVGILIAYLQINSVKKINNQIKEEIDNSISKKDTLLSVSDLQKAIQFIHYINDKINCGKYELVHLRMNDLKTILIEIRDKKNPKNINRKIMVSIYLTWILI